MKPLKLLSAAVALAGFCCGPAALATPLGTSYIFTLTTSQSAAGLPAGPYATVTLTQGTDQVDVDVKLTAGFLFAYTGVGPAFAFNLDDAFTGAAVNLSTATAQYFTTGTAATFNLTPYGIFSNALLFKSTVGTGLSAGVAGPLDFSVQAANISLDDFTTSIPRNNGQMGNYAFAIDLGYAATGKTGGVAEYGFDHQTVTPPSTPVPEPASVALLGLGLGGLAVLRRKRHSASG